MHAVDVMGRDGEAAQMNELHKVQHERNDYMRKAQIWKERTIAVAMLLVVLALTALAGWVD